MTRGGKACDDTEMSVDLGGAADLHCHFGPDAHRERSVDAFEAAREAAAAGHRAVVLKSHDFPTAALAWSVGQMVPVLAICDIVTDSSPCWATRADEAAPADAPDGAGSRRDVFARFDRD